MSAIDYFRWCNHLHFKCIIVVTESNLQLTFHQTLYYQMYQAVKTVPFCLGNAWRGQGEKEVLEESSCWSWNAIIHIDTEIKHFVAVKFHVAFGHEKGKHKLTWKQHCNSEVWRREYHGLGLLESVPGLFAIMEETVNSQVYQDVVQDYVRVAVHQLKLSRSLLMQQDKNPS